MISYAALAVISAATLAYEVLLVRLFAIVQWHHFASMAISIALLGFGVSGTLLAIWRERVRLHFAPIFAASAALFALFAPASFLAAQALPFNALAVLWDPRQLLYLLVMYLLLVVPFFCGATCVGLAFVSSGDRTGRVYALNLIGSGGRCARHRRGASRNVAVGSSSTDCRCRPCLGGANSPERQARIRAGSVGGYSDIGAGGLGSLAG